MLLQARNTAGAGPGDLVRIRVPEIGVVKASFWAYGVPTLGGVAGGVAGWHIAGALSLAADAGAVAGAVVGLALAYRSAMAYDKRLRASWQGPEVVEVLASEEASHDKPLLP
jgi:positive regulator of sigma E activity